MKKINNIELKDVENMTNDEFADYLCSEISQLTRTDSALVDYQNNPVYYTLMDDINFTTWNKGLLTNKISFCEFDEVAEIPSKGNRKEFINIVKQTIKYLEK